MGTGALALDTFLRDGVGRTGFSENAMPFWSKLQWTVVKVEAQLGLHCCRGGGQPVLDVLPQHEAYPAGEGEWKGVGHLWSQQVCRYLRYFAEHWSQALCRLLPVSPSPLFLRSDMITIIYPPPPPPPPLSLSCFLGANNANCISAYDLKTKLCGT